MESSQETRKFSLICNRGWDISRVRGNARGRCEGARKFTTVNRYSKTRLCIVQGVSEIVVRLAKG